MGMRIFRQLHGVNQSLPLWQFAGGDGSTQSRALLRPVLQVDWRK
jgi:hypothetical protein